MNKLPYNYCFKEHRKYKEIALHCERRLRSKLEGDDPIILSADLEMAKASMRNIESYIARHYNGRINEHAE